MWSGKENNWVRNCTSHTRNILKVCRVINNLFYDFLIINYRVFISFQSSLNYQLKHFFRWLIKTYYGNKVTCWHHIFTAMKDMKNCTFVRNDFIFVNMWSMEKNLKYKEIKCVPKIKSIVTLQYCVSPMKWIYIKFEVCYDLHY